MKTIAIANIQGGSGKTLTAYALSYGLAKHGYKVLSVDADWQGMLTNMCAVGPANREKSLSYLLEQGDGAASEVMQEADGGFSIIPSNLSLFSERMDYGKTALRDALRIYEKDFDYCIIDAPCYMGSWFETILVAAGKIIIPANSINPVINERTFEIIENVRRSENPSLTIAGFLFTCAVPESSGYNKIKEELQQTAEKLNTRVYKSEIRRDGMVQLAELKKQNVFESYPETEVVTDYATFVEEFIQAENL